MHRALILVAAAATPAAASHQDIETMQASAEQGQWAACAEAYAQNLAEDTIRDDMPITLGAAVGKLGAGSQSIGAVGKQCVALVKSEPRSEQKWKGNVQRFLYHYLPNLEHSPGYLAMRSWVASCRVIADAATAGGDTTEKIEVRDDYGQKEWTGTIPDLAPLCDRGAKLADDAKAKYLEPFKQAGIKGDKLALLETVPLDKLLAFDTERKQLDNMIKTLAAATVWFETRGGMSCPQHRSDYFWSVARYQFDAAGKLVKSTTTPPSCERDTDAAYK